MTTKEIILSWLNHKTRLNKEFEFSSNDLQTQLPNFGLIYYHILHTPDLYSREWRKIRQYSEQWNENGKVVVITQLPKFDIIEFEKKGSKQKWYKVTRN